MKIFKTGVVVALIATVVSLIWTMQNAQANIEPAEQEAVSAAPAPAALTTNNWRDVYDLGDLMSGAAGDISNAAYAQATGKIPGTQIDLSDTQKAQLLDQAKSAAVTINARYQNMLSVTGLSQSTINNWATANPAPTWEPRQ